MVDYICREIAEQHKHPTCKLQTNQKFEHHFIILIGSGGRFSIQS